MNNNCTKNFIKSLENEHNEKWACEKDTKTTAQECNHGYAITRAHFAILHCFQRSGTYQAIGDKNVKIQPRHIHSIPND